MCAPGDRAELDQRLGFPRRRKATPVGEAYLSMHLIVDLVRPVFDIEAEGELDLTRGAEILRQGFF